VRCAAGDAAGIVTRTGRAGGSRAAARAALAPTIAELQRSAFTLLDRMLPTLPLPLPVAPDASELGRLAALPA